MSALRRILCVCLLAGGALAGLLGPGAPAEPRDAAPALEPVEVEVWPAGEWTEGELVELESPEPSPRAVEIPAPAAPRGEPDAAAEVDLVRRMLAVHARLGEE